MGDLLLWVRIVFFLEGFSNKVSHYDPTEHKEVKCQGAILYYWSDIYRLDFPLDNLHFRVISRNF